VKTTIDLSDDLAKKAKRLAAKRGVTLRAVIEEGIRRVVREDRSTGEFKLRDAGVDGNGLQPGFREGRWEQIREAAYEGRGG